MLISNLSVALIFFRTYITITYSRSPLHVASALEAASVMKANMDLNLKSGMEQLLSFLFILQFQNSDFISVPTCFYYVFFAKKKHTYSYSFHFSNNSKILLRYLCNPRDGFQKVYLSASDGWKKTCFFFKLPNQTKKAGFNWILLGFGFLNMPNSFQILSDSFELHAVALQLWM